MSPVEIKTEIKEISKQISITQDGEEVTKLKERIYELNSNLWVGISWSDLEQYLKENYHNDVYFNPIVRLPGGRLVTSKLINDKLSLGKIEYNSIYIKVYYDKRSYEDYQNS